MTKKESQNGSTMGISYYTINEKVSKTRQYDGTWDKLYIAARKVQLDERAGDIEILCDYESKKTVGLKTLIPDWWSRHS